MPDRALTEWDRYQLWIATLEVCDAEAGIRIQDVRRHPRLLPYIQANESQFREILRGFTATGLLWRSGRTSGKLYRTSPVGTGVIPLYYARPPTFLRTSSLDDE